MLEEKLSDTVKMLTNEYENKVKADSFKIGC